MRLQVSTVLLQWAAGGLLFCWVTTRRREVGIGYGWTLRITYLVLAAAGVLAGRTLEAGGTAALIRDAAGFGMVAATGWALALSVARRKAGVAVQRDLRHRRIARVEAMIGRSRPGRFDETVPEFPPAADLLAPALGVVGMFAGAVAGGGPLLLALARLLIGAAFLGAVTDAMLLGHWYLTQPGLSRQPLKELVRWTAVLWPVEVLALCWPTGMLEVLAGSVNDGSGGLLGWIWATSTVTTILLLAVTAAALREKWYSAVMSATGLLYLAILTAFGTDLVARAVLAP
jgi:hypothetical protein